MTSTGSVIGTWAYMAPERLANGQTDARADIYALTCVLHECLTGTRPFPGDSLEQQITGHLTVPPPRPSELSADVPAELDTVVATGMAKNPDERYETAKDLARAARAAIIAPTADPSPSVALTEPASAHHEVSHIAPTQYGPPTGPRPQTPALEPADNKKPRRRFRIVLAAGIGVIAIVGVVAGVLVINRDKAGDAEPAPSAIPNSGPFTGVFDVEFGPGTDANGAPRENSPPTKETWAIRSVCRDSGCVATAQRRTGDTVESKSFVFDDLGGRWVAVATRLGTCDRQNHFEMWETISLQPRPDGTLFGEYSYYYPIRCGGKRTVTFTRTGDVTAADGVADPASQSPRVASQAQALYGSYRLTRTYPAMTVDDNLVVQTVCLRSGERCMSYFHGDSSWPLVFSNGAWTTNFTIDGVCPAGGTSVITINGRFPLLASSTARRSDRQARRQGTT